MYQHSCARAGAEGCGWSTTASSDEELRTKLEEHVKHKHRVPGGLNDTIYKYLRQIASR
jgi:predicted small metal-binding protein